MRTLWVQKPTSNLLVPAGSTSSVASTSEISFLEGKDQAAAVRQLYTDHCVNLNSNCDLSRHIAAAVEVSDSWLLDRARRIQTGTLVRGIQMDKIATFLLAAKGSPRIKQYLRHLTSGSLDVFDRQPSRAKNALWELELHSLLINRALAAELREPDTLAHLNDLPIGFACKKIYSHKNVEKTLSRGVAQIEQVSEYGLIAINIDDLWPPNQIRVATSDEMLGQSLSQENLGFLDRHDRHFRKYLSTGRIMGVMVASGGIAYVGSSFQSARQFTTWAMPDLEASKASLLHDLQQQIQARW